MFRSRDHAVTTWALAKGLVANGRSEQRLSVWSLQSWIKTRTDGHLAMERSKNRFHRLPGVQWSNACLPKAGNRTGASPGL
jgi:hypothetical protein